MEVSKDKFFQVIDNIKEGYFEVDLWGNFTFFNKSLLKITGYSREELLGLNYRYITDEKNRKKIFEGFNTVFQTGQPLTDFEYQFKNKSGEKVIGETSVYLKYDSKGNKIGFYGIFRDITKKKEEQERFKKEAEQLINLRTLELKESEEKFHQLFNKAPYPIGLFDLEGKLIECNNATSILLSTHTLKDYIGKNYKEFWAYHEKDKPLISLFDDKFTEIIKKGNTSNFEFPIYRTKGGIIWCFATASKIKIGNKEFIQIILNDISAQKEAQQKLRESEKKYRNLVENAQEGVWAVDENDVTIFVNPKICDMLGYTKDEMMGKSLHLFLEDSMTEFVNSYRERRERGLKDTYELEFIKKDGSILSTNINAAPIFSQSGEFKGSFAYINDITNRKIAELKLKESEEKYRFISENAMDLIAVIDMKLRFEYINEKVHSKVMGYKKEELIGKNAIEFIHPDDREKVLNIFKKALDKGEVFAEVRIRHKDGHYKWIGNNGTIYIDKKGKPKFLIIARDITKRKKAEIRLMESEEKYRSMINHLDLGFYQLTWDGILLNHNPKFCEILGYSLYENLKNKDVHEFWQKAEERKTYLTELEKTGYIKNYLVNAKKKNGENIVLQLNSHIIKKSEGKPVLIQGLISDITQKFELEKKLMESEERYRNLIESVPFSIALINKQGEITYCNPVIEKLLGYHRDELIGYQFKDLPLIHPKYLPILLRRFQQVINGEILTPFEIELYKKDSSMVWVRYQSTLVKLGNEELLQVILNDITEQKQADLLIEEEIIKLKELDQIRKDLISRVSHELKTPLVSVCGAAELLLNSFIDEFKDEPKELIEMIEKGGKRLKYLVDNLVDITRIEYKKFKLEKELNDFNQIVRDCTRELMYLIKKREINLELNLMDDLYLEVDKVRIEQVILNLLSNAIKNTPPNGKITINSLQVDNCVQLSIRDTGIGLIKEEIDRLFTKFGKIERYGDGMEYIDIQGTGLGLYISKEIIDLHKGQIWVKSAGRHKGSEFSLKIPIRS
ncbi:MAG: PAS domain S-box protein [Promethearchaeota archaeon]